MKILYFTDTHIRNTTPRHRRDNYQKAIYLKICEILQIAKTQNVDVILHGGDVFDRPDISPVIVKKYADIFKSVEIPMYVIAGNHDLYEQNPDSVNSTMLGLLDKLEVIRLIKPDEKVFVNKDVTLQITGRLYYQNIDRANTVRDYVVTQKNTDYAVHMVHGMLLEKPFYEGMPCTLIKDIAMTAADITFAGHYHSGFKPIKIDNKFFINPGGIARINNNISELERIPKYVIADLNQTGININFYKIKSAALGKDVFAIDMLSQTHCHNI